MCTIEILRTTLSRDGRSPAGWVLLISDDFEQARVLVALFVSITFLTLHVSAKPYRRCRSAILTSDFDGA
eukprot:3071932-Prymnesium_polylepis.2